MNKNNIKTKTVTKITLLVIIVYCILSLIRSTGLLYLAYTDDYFYNFNFELDQYMVKRFDYYRVYYTITYIIGLIVPFFLKKIFHLNWYFHILSIIIGLAIFILIDSEYIRPLFGFFKNGRANIIIHLLTFIVIGFSLLFFYRKTLKK